MKFGCDLSWKEKCDIADGSANHYKYSTGYSFNVKSDVAEGQKRKEEKKKQKQ